MAKLKAAARAKMPKEKFALPGKKKFPVEDKPHAVAAKGRATQQVNKGKMSKATEAKIDAKADRALDQKIGDEKHMLPGQRGHYRYK